MTDSKKSRANLSTEKQNPSSVNLDMLSSAEILTIISNEDRTVADRVREALPEIEKVVGLTTDAIRSGNRIFYIGAGTSGRLGVLDASEMPPTFSAPHSWFTGIIAGGDDALKKSIEGAEDKPEEAVTDLMESGFSAGDVLIGISTSGAAAYVKSAIEYAQSKSGKAVYLICNPKPFLDADADVIIRVDVGPEVITGSTRMKSGTATKLVLNMISTTTMVNLGKVYGNLMVDLMAVNEKLVDRGIRIISQLTDLNYEEAKLALFEANKSVKKAIVMVNKNCSLIEAEKSLNEVGGSLRSYLNSG